MRKIFYLVCITCLFLTSCRLHKAKIGYINPNFNVIKELENKFGTINRTYGIETTNSRSIIPEDAVIVDSNPYRIRYEYKGESWLCWEENDFLLLPKVLNILLYLMLLENTLRLQIYHPIVTLNP